MATFSAVKTRLQNRLGLGAVGTVESSRLTEALNAGLHRAASDGIPGMLREVYIGYTYTELSVTIAAHTIDTSLITFSADIHDKNVFPQDILVLGSNKFLVQDITGNRIVDIGADHPSALTGSGTIIRRSIELPTAGQVVAVREVDGGKLEPHAQNAAFAPVEEGTAHYFEQRYFPYLGITQLVLYPAPTSSTSFSIIQNAEVTSDADLKMTDSVIDAVLERAVKAYRGWDDGVSQLGLAASEGAVIDTSDQLKNSGNAKQGYVRQ